LTQTPEPLPGREAPGDPGHPADGRERPPALEAASQDALASLIHYRELFEFAPDSYLVTDLTGIIQEANSAAARLFSTPKEFLVGKPLVFLMCEEDRSAFLTRLNRLNLRGEPVRAWEVGTKTRHGTSCTVEMTVTAVRDREERPAGLHWLLRDITDRLLAAEQLRAEKEFADSLLETAQVVVLVLDHAGKVLRANAFFETVSGFRRHELFGNYWWVGLIPEEDWGQVQREFWKSRTGGQSAPTAWPLRTRDGRLRTLQWSLRPLTDPAGQTSAVLVIGHDITELEEAQRQALHFERLAAIGQMASGLAHEARNAIQRSQACLQRLQWKLHGQPAALDLVARTQKAQDDLLRLYEDVREYAAPIRLDRHRHSLAEVWREAWGQLASLNPGCDARLEEDVGGMDLALPVDRFRLGQVFRNLFENALAACADPVCVRVSCREAWLADRPALEIRVRDNGPGFTAEQRQRLFEPFFTTKLKGCGLGMAIAKRIVEAHGGQIAVGDGPGPGAEILIALPRSP
jgi:PAS domain S-box-containing protein